MVKFCRICRASLPTKSALAAHVIKHQRRRRRYNRIHIHGDSNSNTLVLELKEYWGTVATKQVDVVDCKPSNSRCEKLAAQTLVFETYKMTMFTVQIVAAGSPSAGGVYFAGVSFKSDQHPSDSKGVAALSPMVCKNAQENASLSVSCARFTTWLDTNGPSPGAVVISNDTDDLLHVWVSYRCVFKTPITPVMPTLGMDEISVTRGKSISVELTSGLHEVFKTDGLTWWDRFDQPIVDVKFDGKCYAELEVGGSASSLVTAWALLRTAWSQAEELHRTFEGNIGIVYFIADTAQVTLPTFGAPAILHLQQRPLRATESEWRMLGYEVADENTLSESTC